MKLNNANLHNEAVLICEAMHEGRVSITEFVYFFLQQGYHVVSIEYKAKQVRLFDCREDRHCETPFVYGGEA